jgi:hypothetical protein
VSRPLAREAARRVDCWQQVQELEGIKEFGHHEPIDSIMTTFPVDAAEVDENDSQTRHARHTTNLSVDFIESSISPEECRYVAEIDRFVPLKEAGNLGDTM